MLLILVNWPCLLLIVELLGDQVDFGENWVLIVFLIINCVIEIFFDLLSFFDLIKILVNLISLIWSKIILTILFTNRWYLSFIKKSTHAIVWVLVSNRLLLNILNQMFYSDPKNNREDHEDHSQGVYYQIGKDRTSNKLLIHCNQQQRDTTKKS